MNPQLQAILDTIQNTPGLSDIEKELLIKSVKEADKVQSFAQFKLDRLERDKQTLAIMLEETIEDLQKKSKAIEEQNRELEIESALERVRSVAMGMKKPEDMLDICKTISNQLASLGIKEIRNIQTAIFYEEKGTYMNYQYYSRHDKTFITDTIYTNHEVGKDFAAKMIKGKGEFYITHIKGRKEVDEWIAYQRSTNVFIDEYLYTASSLSYYWYSLGPVALGISTYFPLTEEEENLFKRFLNVFELAYRRYLDIEKAEAQARESQIQLALERVRARTMAMQKSEELSDVAYILFQQFKDLGEELFQITIGIFNEETSLVEFRITGSGGTGSRIEQAFVADIHEPTLINKFYQSWKQKKTSQVLELSGEELKGWIRYRNQISGIYSSETKIAPGESRFIAAGFFSKGLITISKPAAFTEETIQLLERFASVFDLSYTRFQDLKQAEAQVREAKIEAALERTRTQSMIMQHSKELDDTLRVFHEQVLLLGIKSEFSFLWLPDEDKDRHIFWAAWAENNSKIFKSKAINYSLDRNEPATAQCLIDWKRNQPIVSYHVPPDGVENYFAAWKELLDGVENLKPEYFKEGLYYVEAFMKYGCFGVMVKIELQEDEIKILYRFTIEFERSYTRFLDLQQAEAQTREALIEGALERVCARALAMQQPEELKDVAQVMRNEMGALGVEELETSSIYIHGDSSDNVECWFALQDPKHTEKKMVSDHFILNLDDTWVGREMKKFYLSNEKQTSVVMQGTNRREWIEYCYKHSPVFSGFYGETIPDRTYHLYKFSHGYIGAAAPGDISAESWKLLSRAASVFSLAYSRFRDLTQARTDLIKLKEEKKRAEDALTELQATQKQLIQSEKMASLGELTAGIAHEIQNPLNFVNNFSDVSNELLEEMKTELDKGNVEDAKAIADDVKQNLEKILHHGKRADGIVKGMLQHSRTSTGQKELTDINALADEYLRLAYHGLRAKDKTFNAATKTDYDESIGLVKIIPQDMGRVILNLITNAFYAVTEKKKRQPENYEPVVSVSTKKVGDKVLVSVKDNGTGIPQKVLDKIFQPFFTTKPTGQGTGLGLSLSYDIVKAHGGELKVETKEGGGSTFIIQLPIN